MWGLPGPESRMRLLNSRLVMSLQSKPHHIGLLFDVINQPPNSKLQTDEVSIIGQLTSQCRVGVLEILLTKPTSL